MYNVLLVDDEAHWVEGIAYCLEREMPGGLGRIHKASNGYEALECLASYPIHIVITDIVMPVMSGVELVQEIRSRWNGIACIILSGHAEFDYARKLMMHQPVDYLLKPVRDPQLLDAVRRACLQVEEREKLRLNNGVPTGAAHLETVERMRRDLLSRFLAGRGEPENEWRQTMELYGIAIPYGTLCMLMLVRLDPGAKDADELKADGWMQEFAELAEEMLGPSFHLWSCRDRLEHLVYLVAPKPAEGDGVSEGKTASELRGLASRIQHRMMLQHKSVLSLLLTDGRTFPNQTAACYREALQRFRQETEGRQGMLMTMGRHSGEAFAPSPSPSPSPASASASAGIEAMKQLYEPPRLSHLVEAARWAELDEKLAGIFRELYGSFPYSYEHLLEAASEIAGSIAYAAHSNGERLADLLGNDFEPIASGLSFSSIPELEEWSCRAFERIRTGVVRESSPTRLDMVQKVHQYIESHLHENVSLQALADHVYMHPTHLSKVYRMETGENVSHYLNRFRMEKAAYLLRQSSEKTYRIGERVGLPNPAYFIKVFKKFHGVTPQEYRGESAIRE